MNFDKTTVFLTEMVTEFEKVMEEIRKILGDTPKKKIRYDGKTYKKNPWIKPNFTKRNYISCHQAFIPRASKLRETKRIRRRKQS